MRTALAIVVLGTSLARAGTVEAPGARALPQASVTWAVSIKEFLNTPTAADPSLDPAIAGLRGVDPDIRLLCVSFGPAAAILQNMGVDPREFLKMKPARQGELLSRAMPAAALAVWDRTDYLAAHESAAEGGVERLSEAVTRLDEARDAFSAYLGPERLERLNEARSKVWRRLSHLRAEKLRDSAELTVEALGLGWHTELNRPSRDSAPSLRESIRTSVRDIGKLARADDRKDAVQSLAAVAAASAEGGAHEEAVAGLAARLKTAADLGEAAAIIEAIEEVAKETPLMSVKRRAISALLLDAARFRQNPYALEAASRAQAIALTGNARTRAAALELLSIQAGLAPESQRAAMGVLMDALRPRLFNVVPVPRQVSLLVRAGKSAPTVAGMGLLLGVLGTVGTAIHSGWVLLAAAVLSALLAAAVLRRR